MAAADSKSSLMRGLIWVGHHVGHSSRQSSTELKPASDTASASQRMPFDSPELLNLLQDKVAQSLATLELEAEARAQGEAKGFAGDLLEQHCLYLLACKSSEVAREWSLADTERNKWLESVFNRISLETDPHPLCKRILDKKELAGRDIKSALIGVVETAYNTLAKNQCNRVMNSPLASARLVDRQAYRQLMLTVAYAAADELCRRYYQRGLPSGIPRKIDGSILSL